MYLAVIETQKDNDSLQEDSICKLYEVGAVKTDEEMVSAQILDALSVTFHHIRRNECCAHVCV